MKLRSIALAPMMNMARGTNTEKPLVYVIVFAYFFVFGIEFQNFDHKTVYINRL